MTQPSVPAAQQQQYLKNAEQGLLAEMAQLNERTASCKEQLMAVRNQLAGITIGETIAAESAVAEALAASKQEGDKDKSKA